MYTHIYLFICINHVFTDPLHSRPARTPAAPFPFPERGASRTCHMGSSEDIPHPLDMHGTEGLIRDPVLQPTSPLLPLLRGELLRALELLRQARLHGSQPRRQRAQRLRDLRSSCFFSRTRRASNERCVRQNVPNMLCLPGAPTPVPSRYASN